MNTDTGEKETNGPTEAEQALVNAEPDWYLQNLVDVVNGSETEMPITLNVKGLVISGFLVSGHIYFEGMAEGFTTFFGKEHESTPNTVALLTKSGANYLKDREDKDYPFPYMIHLKDGFYPVSTDGWVKSLKA